MSELAKKLRQVSEGGVQPLGFRASASSPTPSMLLIAALAQPDRLAKLAAEVDGLLVLDSLLVLAQDAAQESKGLQQIADAAGDTPWGIWAKALTSDGISRLVKAGADFIIFDPATAPAHLLQEEEIGKVLEIDPSWDNALAAAVERLPVDAVLLDVRSQGARLTVSHLLNCRRLSGLARKPLLVAAGEELEDGDLQALQEAGAAGVVAQVGEEGTGDKLLKLRQAIEALPPRPRGRREERTPMLPRSEPPASLSPDEV